MDNYTDKILKTLEDINKIPRGSGNMTGIHNYLKKWAEYNSFSYKTDDALNLNISVPPSAGFENSPGIVLQGHMDMVCEKTPDSNHDFLKDPIVHIKDGDWLKADRTTLGADNGIALAAAMTAASEAGIEHPPLELLFTTDEEIGLCGADKIKPGFVGGKILLNMDSEESGVFTAGCAGSSRTFIQIPAEKTGLPDNCTAFILRIGGLKGGHSAMDINKSRGNACELLVRGLSELSDKTDFFISSINGGTAMNAIARSAEAVIVFKKSAKNDIENSWTHFTGNIFSENRYEEDRMTADFEKTDLPVSVFSNSRDIINKMRIIPHGIVNMNPEIPDQIETSLNFAMFTTTSTGIKITTMQRSSVKSRLKDLTAKIKTLAEVFGGEYSLEIFVDPWQPDMDSSLLKRCKEIWKTIFGKDAVIEVTHGGLECGIIANASGGMETVSFGPDIENPHSPDERLYIPSINTFFIFLIELLKSYKKEN